jgi:hypothetical protein
MKRPPKTIPLQIQTLSRRIAWWRQTRTKRSPMPAELWEAAIAAARAHGLSAVARGTGVGYESLRQRSEASASTGQQARAPAGFVAIEPLSAFGGPGAVPPRGAVVELCDGRGAQVTVRLGPGGREAVDVSAIVASLWRREAGSTKP